MSKALHPTDIRLREEHCPHALVLKKQGAHYDREVFQVGVAAHEVLEALGNEVKKNPELTNQQAEKIANRICLKLTTTGREYDGNPEGPMSPSQAMQGKVIAMKHFQYNMLSPTANYEEPFAFDENWNPVDYDDPSAIFRTIIDVVDIKVENEDAFIETKTAIVKDYKTSWHIVQDMMDNTQRRAQALSVILKYPDLDKIILEVVGLRNGKVLQREINVNHEKELIKQFKDEITIALKACHSDSNPAPGLGCMGCPYAHCCKHVMKLAKNSEDTAKKYAAHLAIAKSLEPAVKAATKENPIHDGKKFIGYTKKSRTSPTKTATTTLWEIWKENDGNFDDFLTLHTVNATTAKKILSAFKKQGLNPDEIKDKILAESTYSSFGIHKK